MELVIFIAYGLLITNVMTATAYYRLKNKHRNK